MSDWYTAVGGHQVGPVPLDEILRGIRAGTVTPDTLVFTTEMTNWAAAKDVPQLAPYFPSTTAAVAPPPPVPGRRAHEIDYKVVGAEMQYVEVELDPGESAVAEAGAMMYKSPDVVMETVFGDGSRASGGG